MPVAELMSWVAAQKRWTKMYMGRRYYVSARQLGIKPETKEASLQAANEWWRNKQLELDYAYRANARMPLPLEDVAAASMGVPSVLFGNVRVLLEQALLNEEERRKAGKPLEASLPGITDDTLATVEIDGEPEDAETIRRREVMGLLERLLFGDNSSLPPDIAERLPPARAAQVERAVKELRGEPSSDPQRTVQAQVEAWLRKQQAKVATEGMSPVRWNTLRACVSHFAAFLGESADVSIINGERLDGFHNFCLSKIGDRIQDGKAGWSARYTQEVFAVARQWIRWLWGKDLIQLPKNLDDRWRFESSSPEIKTWSTEEIKRVVGEAPGKLKLALLLMLNTGMTQKDVSDLQDTEVNWRDGTITRKRSKSRKRKNAPTVCYKLWPITFALLKKHRSGKDTVLLTKSGNSYLRFIHVNGKLISRDNFAGSFRQLRERLDFRKPMKLLRKTSASLLESHPVYGRLTSLFLGHAPASIKDKHYAQVPQTLFDEAVTWLGQQYGFVDG